MGQHFLQYLYRLFLLFFRTQTNNPHCLSIRPFRYGVTLTTSGLMIFCLLTRALLKPQPHLALWSLYPPFRDYLSTISGRYIHIERTQHFSIPSRFNRPPVYQLTSLVREPQYQRTFIYCSNRLFIVTNPLFVLQR